MLKEVTCDSDIITPIKQLIQVQTQFNDMDPRLHSITSNPNKRRVVATKDPGPTARLAARAPLVAFEMPPHQMPPKNNATALPRRFPVGICGHLQASVGIICRHCRHCRRVLPAGFLRRTRGVWLMVGGGYSEIPLRAFQNPVHRPQCTTGRPENCCALNSDKMQVPVPQSFHSNAAASASKPICAARALS